MFFFSCFSNFYEKQLLDADQTSIASLFSKEAIYELHKIVETEQWNNRDNLICNTSDTKKTSHIIFKSLEQQDLLKGKFITMKIH